MASIPAEFQPFIGVLILAVLFFFTSSMIHRYREIQAQKMQRAQQLISGADEIEHALIRLSGMELPRELGDFCRQELVIRYQEVNKLFPAMEDVQQRLRQAEAMDSGQGPWELPNLETQAQLNSYTLGLSGILDILSNRGAKSLDDVEKVKSLREKIRAIRAQAQYEFHARHSREHAEKGEWGRAQEEILKLMGYLKAKAPANEMGKALYQQAAQLYHHYLHQEVQGEAA